MTRPHRTGAGRAGSERAADADPAAERVADATAPAPASATRPAADRERRRHRRPVYAVGIAAAALCAVLVASPGTSGAFIARITGDGSTAASASYFTCAAVQAGERTGALFSWSLTQPSGSTSAPDTDSGAYPGTYRNSMTSTTTTPQACPRDAGGSYSPTDNLLLPSYLTSPLQVANPTTFSVELWFRTTAKGGRLIGFGDQQVTQSATYDRHLYVNTAGRLVFGTYGNGAIQTLQSPGVVSDGVWRHAVATLSPTAGSVLYVDGVQVAANANSRVAQVFTGYWRIGWDNLASWPAAGSYAFVGNLRFASVYSVALTPAQVASHYVAGR